MIARSRTRMLLYPQSNSCYLLTKGANGVKAKFVGTSMLGPKDEGHLDTEKLGD
jgi:hypothetical protein